MSQAIVVKGGNVLKGGRAKVSGSSNQVTKAIIASILTNEDVIIQNCPCVNERAMVEDLIRALGGSITYLNDNDICINSSHVNKNVLGKDLCMRNRLAILTLGPLLHKFSEVSMYAALGGDKIGKRPVDFHLKGLQEMGALVEIENNEYRVSVPDGGLHGAHIILPFPSVMTTENLIMAATLAKGRTIIENAAIEPEIIELVKMLQRMGADIMVNANRTYIIQGVKKLHGCSTYIMPDRNEAVSLGVAALATGGNILLENIHQEDIYSFLNFIQRMGASFDVNSEGIFLSTNGPGKLIGTHIEVEVHPGFMTDWQQPFMVLFTQAQGISVLHETIFEQRLGYTEFLKSMGANITLFSTCLGEAPCRFRNRNYVHSAVIQGPTPLHAGIFQLPTDIRAGMCLVIAGLVASGVSELTNIHELKRKYDSLVPKLQKLGADITYSCDA